jgi:hypothetical protein
MTVLVKRLRKIILALSVEGRTCGFLLPTALRGTMEANAGAIDYWTLASALGGVLIIAIVIWIAIVGRR